MAKAFKAMRLLGLLALALGLMAIGATAAQAEAIAHWNVAGSSLINNTLLPELQADLENNHGAFLFEFDGRAVEFLCTALKLVGSKLEASGEASGKVHFAGCVTKVEGVIEGACTPHSPGAPEGLIETNALTGLIVLHEEVSGTKVPLLEVVPTVGTVFVVLRFGKEVRNQCLLFLGAAEFVIVGKVMLKDCQGEDEVEKVTHLVEEEKALSKLFFGGNPTPLDGSADISLVGTHEGLTFSGIPG
jgi:hypothetical protein